ncbi:MAG: hypothetical protein AAF485_17580 [Chloroflexota bacterium]
MQALSKKLTYKLLFRYSLALIALLIIAVPVFATTNSGDRVLDLGLTADTGNTIQTAQALSPGINVDHLGAGQEVWYVYSQELLNEPDLAWMSLALRFQSEARISSDQVNFEVISAQADDSWFQNSVTLQETLGLGAPSPVRAENQSLTEAFWTGELEAQQRYYVRVFNNTPFGLDYTLEAQPEQPSVPGALPAALGPAETLNARQLSWTLTAQAVENMTAEQSAVWMKKAQSVGWLVTEGTIAMDAPNPSEASPEVLWALIAEAIEGQDAETSATWLMQADSLGWLSVPLSTIKNPNFEVPPAGNGGGGEGGEAEEPPAEPAPPQDAYAPVNIYPNNPLTFDLNEVNSGRLGPYGEHWYLFRRDDLDEDLIESMNMTMFFTPRKGFISDRINFFLFPANQYHIWSRGDTDYMTHFGLGMWTSRDEDPDTGERLWAGALVGGETT